MLVTITQFKQLMTDVNGAEMPIPKGKVGHEVLTATGAADACHADARFVRIATDTDVSVDAYGDSHALLLPAGSVEFFPVSTAAQVFTLS